MFYIEDKEECSESLLLHYKMDKLSLLFSQRKTTEYQNYINLTMPDFYGHTPSGDKLNVAEHQGIINYEPTELVITARAGIKIKIIEQILADNNQMLAFEPPAFGDNATLGGTIACNFSGPRRAYSGAARDSVLGTKIINGKAEVLSFGGEVMKNVAGYDISRLMAGAMGTLGVLLEVSLKVVPKPETNNTNTNYK
jgi:glycolate oxidase FAD binding subunit